MFNEIIPYIITWRSNEKKRTKNCEYYIIFHLWWGMRFHLMKYLTNYGQQQICVVSSMSCIVIIATSRFLRVKPIITQRFKNLVYHQVVIAFAFYNWTLSGQIYFIITPLPTKPAEVQISIISKLFLDNYPWLHVLCMLCIEVCLER